MDVKVKAKEDARLVAVAAAGHFDVVDPRSRAWVEVQKVALDAAGKA